MIVLKSILLLALLNPFIPTSQVNLPLNPQTTVIEKTPIEIKVSLDTNSFEEEIKRDLMAHQALATSA